MSLPPLRQHPPRRDRSLPQVARLGHAALLARGGKGNAWIFAEAEQLFLAVESIF
jgi:hypothetical protein